MKLSSHAAHDLALRHFKVPPSRGLYLDFGDGLVLVCTPAGEYLLVDAPVTPEKVERYQREETTVIDSLPAMAAERLIEMIRHPESNKP